MPSSSLFLRSSTTLVSILSLLSVPISAGSSSNVYSLDTEYAGSNFFNGFNFFNQSDPTHGFVTYVDEQTAQNSQLISSGAGQPAIMKVDSTNTYNNSATYYNVNGVGRPSVRIESQKSWTHGLFITDIQHMPGGFCGTWPAFWTLGSGTWPNNGEIDIIEGANAQNTDLSSAHTGVQCLISGANMTGTLNNGDCDYNDLGGNNGVGCGTTDPDTRSYGTGFNSNGGGVYAMEWTSDAINIWFWPRGNVPFNVNTEAPDPSGWGTPVSSFAGPNCDIDNAFNDHRIVFDTTFCGDFGDATWDSSCKASTGKQTCAEYVAKTPGDFVDAFWEVAFVRVFQKPVVVTTSSTTTTTSTISFPTGTFTNATYTGFPTGNATYTGFPTGTATSFPSSTTPYPGVGGSFPGPTDTTDAATATDSATSTDSTTATDSWSSDSSSPTSWDGDSDATNTMSADMTDATGDWQNPSGTAPVEAYDADADCDDASSSMSWEDWSSTTSTSSSDPTSTWADWSSTSEDPASTTTDSWADWSSTSADPVTTTSDSWADWSSTTDAPVVDATATDSWADWSSSSTAADDVDDNDDSSSTATGTWADWSSDAADSTATPVAAASDDSDSSTWADWSSAASTPVAAATGAVGLTTLTVQPQQTSVAPVAAATNAWSNANSNSSSTNPWVASYTGGAASKVTGIMNLFAAGIVGALFLL